VSMQTGKRRGWALGFAERLAGAVRRAGNAVLVGIDPRAGLLPEGFLPAGGAPIAEVARAFERFGRELIDVVAPLVPAVKFQAAFYEQLGPAGMRALDAGTRAAKAAGLLVILDGKRNDIGSTAEAYAEAYLGAPGADAPWEADALTVSPYLGGDGIAPFTTLAARHGKGVFALVRTSNPSAGDFQDLVADGKPVYRHVAERLGEWARPLVDGSGYSLLGAVVGATYPAQLAELREALPHVTFLVPGYGSQGGTARDVAPAFDADGLGALVNNSRGLAFAYRDATTLRRAGGDWQRAVELAARDMIDDLAAQTTCARLKA
jgi:orotidine-5'-phosphate decarboxylase